MSHADEPRAPATIGHEAEAHAPIPLPPPDPAANSVPGDRPVAEPGPTPAGAGTMSPGFGGLALTALVALVCGLGGAFAYESYLARRQATNAGTVTATARADEAATRPAADTTEARVNAPVVDTRDLADRLDTLTRRVEKLQKQVDAGSKTGAPSELAEIQVRIADLTTATNNFTPLPSKIDHLNNRVSELSSTLTSLRNDVTAFQSRFGTLGRSAPSEPSPRESGNSDSDSRPSTTPTPLPDRRGNDPDKVATEAADPRSLADAAGLFRRGKYKEARDAFGKLELSSPDDARVWYYAALCYGFSTKDWTDGAVRLVEKGLAREEAGTPKKSEIDAAFKDLDSSRGKDWLSAYRKRVNDKSR